MAQLINDPKGNTKATSVYTGQAVKVLARAQDQESSKGGSANMMMALAAECKTEEQFKLAMKDAYAAWRGDHDKVASKAGAIKGDKGGYIVPSTIANPKSQIGQALKQEVSLYTIEEVGPSNELKPYKVLVRDVAAAKEAAKDTGGDDETETEEEDTPKRDANIQLLLNQIGAESDHLEGKQLAALAAQLQEVLKGAIETNQLALEAEGCKLISKNAA